MKKLILLFTLLFLGVSVNANELHTIILEGTDDGYNIILNSDKLPEVNTVIKNSDNIVLNVKGVKPSKSVSAIYRSSADINGLVIENVDADELKIYISAKDISRSTVLAQLTDGETVLLRERFPVEKILWSLAVVFIMIGLYKSAKALTEYENSIVIKRDIKTREIELYRDFQRELYSTPSIDYRYRQTHNSDGKLRSRRNYKELARR